MSAPLTSPGSDGPRPTGSELRRRVRRITAAAVGAATVAAALLTANLAWAASDDQPADATGSTTTQSGTDDESGPAVTSTAPRSTAALAAPQQLPNSTSGRGQARSGGS